MSDDDSVIYADDFTRVFSYQSRQFTMGDLSLRGVNGIQWDAAIPALVIAVSAALLLGMLLLVVGVAVWWALLAVPLPMTVVYVKMAKERGAGLTEGEKLQLRAHFRFRQPREILGLGANSEPTSFNWDTILWSPAAVRNRWAVRP